MRHSLTSRLLAFCMAGVMSLSLVAGLALPARAAATNPDVKGVLVPDAAGKTTYGNQYTTIDASHLDQGYVMIKYQAGESRRIKVQIAKTGGTTYSYDLAADGKYDTFPLPQGDGSYKISVFRNVEGTKYSTIYSTTVEVKLTNQLMPFLYPNQYVDFTADSKAVAKGAELAKGKTDELQIITAIYNFVVRELTYDYDLAKTVKSGYLPVVDSVLAAKKGICFDYAALMSTMLRSQGIPTKLMVGYTSTGEYHAWISTHVSNKGWVNNIISFDGVSWKLMDPTFASTGKESKAIMDFINDPKNYSEKYCY